LIFDPGPRPNGCATCELPATLWAGPFSARLPPSARASASTVGDPLGTSSVLLSRVTPRNVSDFCEHLLRASCYLLLPIPGDLMERRTSGSLGDSSTKATTAPTCSTPTATTSRRSTTPFPPDRVRPEQRARQTPVLSKSQPTRKDPDLLCICCEIVPGCPMRTAA
jgi:hypothetical protein